MNPNHSGSEILGNANPIISVIGAGAMGSQIAHRLFQSGAGPILTNLDGRSPETCKRAAACGMKDTSYADIVSRATYILSVVPPRDAFAIAKIIADTVKSSNAEETTPYQPRTKLVFIDCNAVNPSSAKQMAQLFVNTSATFIDGAIVGGPPSEVYNPGLYICADPNDEAVLDELEVTLEKYGLQPFSLKGEGAGIGDASAVKMANSGIVKGTIALFTSMILASYTSSPSTSQGLLHSLHISQSTFINQMIRLVPQMTPKAYRFVGEMKEVAKFTEDQGLEDIGCIYEGAARIFQQIANAHEARGREQGRSPVYRIGEGSEHDEIDMLLTVIENARILEAGEGGKSWDPSLK
ncbi:6-phosphogluconate dehydrogenase C-terminal domain-like protein [Lentinula novae-zelandiae]|nr:6-phosphogluconate dehydrogenase C-terminal domain-like protein [Lentinula novae-zelandiae]